MQYASNLQIISPFRMYASFSKTHFRRNLSMTLDNIFTHFVSEQTSEGNKQTNNKTLKMCKSSQYHQHLFTKIIR